LANLVTYNLKGTKTSVAVPTSEDEVRTQAQGGIDLNAWKQDLATFISTIGPGPLSDVSNALFDIVSVVLTVGGVGLVGMAGKGLAAGAKAAAGTGFKAAAGTMLKRGAIGIGTNVARTGAGAVGTGITSLNFPSGDANAITDNETVMNPNYQDPAKNILGGLKDSANVWARWGSAIGGSGRYEFDKETSKDILSGFDDRYIPIVRMAADGIAWINKIAREIQTEEYDAAQKEQLFDTQSKITGTAQNYYTQLIAAVKSENDVEIERIVSEITAAENRELIANIRRIGNERSGNTVRWVKDSDFEEYLRRVRNGSK
jgi:hypothetical protein